MANTAQAWWSDLLPSRYNIGTGALSWEQLGPQGQQAVSNYYNRLANQYIGQQRQDIWGSPMRDEIMGTPVNWANNEDLSAYLAGDRAGVTLDGYSARTLLPQASMLYGIDPAVAKALGIDQATALALANQAGEQYNEAQNAADSANAREGWMMFGAALAPAAWQYISGAQGAAGAANGAVPNLAAEGFTPAIANAADPIEAIYAAMETTGASTATEAATALGFGSTEAMLSAINPAWVGVGAGLGSSIGSGLKTAASGAGSSIMDGLGSNAGRLLAAGAGGLLAGAGGGPKQSGTTTTTQAPWEKQQPYLTDVWSNAQDMFNNGSPLYSQATQNMQSLLGGPMYNPTMGLNNPYLENAISTAQDEVVRKATGAFNNANRASGSFGNSGLQEAFARELPQQLANVSTSMRMQDYGNQQNLFENAVNRSTAATGNATNFQWQPLQNYSNIVGSGNWGGTTQQPYYTNNASNILGGVATGVGLYNTLFGGK